MTTGLADFFKQNLWANLCLLDACANLTDDHLPVSRAPQRDAPKTEPFQNTNLPYAFVH